jgi:hypothetical protein
VESEVFVKAAKGGNEVVLEGAYCPFGGIAAMGAGRKELEVNGLAVHVFLEDRGAFVV